MGYHGPMPPSARPLTATIILAWDGSQATAACLAAVARQTYPNHRTILVDNGATPPIAPPAEPPVTLFRLPENRGFAGGVNAGINAALAAGAAFVWLLNDDAQAPPDTLEKLVAAAAADPRIGIASPVIRNADDHGRPAFTAGRINPATLGFDFTDSATTAAAWAQEAPDRIWAVGTAMLLRRELLEAIGGFDEDLFAYWEDNDICLRAMRAGFRTVMVPDAAVLHPNGDPTTGEAARPPYYHYFMARNHLLVLRKNGGWRVNARPLLWALLRMRREVARYPGRPAIQAAIRHGVWDGLRGSTGRYTAAVAASSRLGQAVLVLAGLAARLRPTRG